MADNNKDDNKAEAGANAGQFDVDVNAHMTQPIVCNLLSHVSSNCDDLMNGGDIIRRNSSPSVVRRDSPGFVTSLPHGSPPEIGYHKHVSPKDKKSLFGESGQPTFVQPSMVSPNSSSDSYSWINADLFDFSDAGAGPSNCPTTKQPVKYNCFKEWPKDVERPPPMEYHEVDYRSQLGPSPMAHRWRAPTRTPIVGYDIPHQSTTIEKTKPTSRKGNRKRRSNSRDSPPLFAQTITPINEDLDKYNEAVALNSYAYQTTGQRSHLRPPNWDCPPKNTFNTRYPKAFTALPQQTLVATTTTASTVTATITAPTTATTEAAAAHLAKLITQTTGDSESLATKESAKYRANLYRAKRSDNAAMALALKPMSPPKKDPIPTESITIKPATPIPIKPTTPIPMKPPTPIPVRPPSPPFRIIIERPTGPRPCLAPEENPEPLDLSTHASSQPTQPTQPEDRPGPWRKGFRFNNFVCNGKYQYQVNEWPGFGNFMPAPTGMRNVDAALASIMKEAALNQPTSGTRPAPSTQRPTAQSAASTAKPKPKKSSSKKPTKLVAAYQHYMPESTKYAAMSQAAASSSSSMARQTNSSPFASSSSSSNAPMFSNNGRDNAQPQGLNPNSSNGKWMQ